MLVLATACSHISDPAKKNNGSGGGTGTATGQGGSSAGLGFYIKAVLAYADARFAPLASPPPIADYHNEMLSGRLRLVYLF